MVNLSATVNNKENNIQYGNNIVVKQKVLQKF